jgi:hypothetical protein
MYCQIIKVTQKTKQSDHDRKTNKKVYLRLGPQGQIRTVCKIATQRIKRDHRTRKYANKSKDCFHKCKFLES